MKHKNVYILLIISLIVFTAGIGSIDIYFLDEAKNAICAREMMQNNNYIIPTYNGVLRSDKPPLHYYFMILSYKIWGVNPFAARFFSAIMGVLTVVCLYLFSKKYVGTKTAFYASLLLVSSLHFNIQMHWSVPDPYFIFLMTLSGLSFYEFYNTGKRKWWFIFYISLGLSFLTKGPVGIVLLSLAVFLFLIIMKDFKWKTIKKINPFLGIPLSLSIAFPWFYAVHKATKGEFTNNFFFKHNFERFTSEMEGHGGVFLLTILFVILGLIPWFFFLLKYKLIKIIIKENSFLLFSFCVSVSIVAFFMISGTKLPNYTVPAYPWIFMLLSAILMKVQNKKPFLIAILVVSIILPIGIIIGIQQDKVIYNLYLLGTSFFIITIGALIAYKLRNTTYKWIHALSASWLLMALVFFYGVFPIIDKENPVEKTISLFEENQNVVGYGVINSAFIFKMKKEIPIFKNIDDLKTHIDNHPKGGMVITRAHKKNEVLFESLGLIEVARERDLFENPTTLILKF
ncbi:ArnT family glycosyltransferase [Tenacibaculum piscium]|uniref:ArnT family glycosyltransferase n=1 Tax=Tenacibaculum piscium TaxID=1458515 RepID=UPI001F2C2808|nr:glycosyltransferase family 39 protein [Tenacibaculum piscium]